MFIFREERDDENDDEEDDGTNKLSKDQELLQHAKQMDDDGVPDPIKRRILMEREGMHATGVKVIIFFCFSLFVYLKFKI